MSDLAALVVEQGKACGLKVNMCSIANPRIEAEQHYYHAAHTKLIELGLEPHLLEGEVLQSLLDYSTKYQKHINSALIAPTVNWRATANQLPDSPTGEVQHVVTNNVF